MALGSLNTNKTWAILLSEVKDELRKWGIHDYVLPIWDESRKSGKVTLEMAKNGKWTPITCGVFTGASNGPQRNLCAIKEALRSNRLADQRGIGAVNAQVAQLLALPDPGDPYAVLGVRRDSTPEEIKLAYQGAVKRWHPDQPEGNPEMFRRVHDAGEKLGIV